jgi:hypothetical protein
VAELRLRTRAGTGLAEWLYPSAANIAARAFTLIPKRRAMRTPFTAEVPPRSTLDKPTREPTEGPGKRPHDAEPHPTSRLTEGTRRLRVRVVRGGRPG